MLKIEKTKVFNLEGAIRGARNPMNSWNKSDSYYDENGNYILGENDLSLAVRLRSAGSDHRKFMRQIFVSVDITAPLYWWKEFDTYKVGTVANSCSTMHKIHAKEFELDDFSFDDMMIEFAVGDDPLEFEFMYSKVIENCEILRRRYIETNDKKYWRALIQMLPESYNQKRTITMNYENCINMYYSRSNHKLNEWHTLCDWIETLPYFKEIVL